MMTQHLNKARALIATGQGKLAATTALALAGIGTAHATDTGGTGADAAFSALESQASEFADSAWPVVIAVVGSLVAISMFKKFANRAS